MLLLAGLVPAAGPAFAQGAPVQLGPGAPVRSGATPSTPPGGTPPSVPVPMARPSFGSGATAVPSANAAPARPTVTSAKNNASFTPIEPALAVQKANATFNAITTMSADFTQTGIDGNKTDGRLVIQKPGKMNFSYAPPVTLEVVADGSTVAIRDRKTLKQDLYLIGQTPLKFLLKDRVDISRDTKVIDVRSDPEITSVFIEDKTTLGGSSKIRLNFATQTFALKEWIITDPQGYDTSIQLTNVSYGDRVDSGLFRINQERILNTDR